MHSQASRLRNAWEVPSVCVSVPVSFPGFPAPECMGSTQCMYLVVSVPVSFPGFPAPEYMGSTQCMCICASLVPRLPGSGMHGKYPVYVYLCQSRSQASQLQNAWKVPSVCVSVPVSFPGFPAPECMGSTQCMCICASLVPRLPGSGMHGKYPVYVYLCQSRSQAFRLRNAWKVPSVCVSVPVSFPGFPAPECMGSTQCMCICASLVPRLPGSGMHGKYPVYVYLCQSRSQASRLRNAWEVPSVCVSVPVSFPGFLALECKYENCEDGESLVSFLT